MVHNLENVTEIRHGEVIEIQHGSHDEVKHLCRRCSDVEDSMKAIGSAIDLLLGKLNEQRDKHKAIISQIWNIVARDTGIDVKQHRLKLEVDQDAETFVITYDHKKVVFPSQQAGDALIGRLFSASNNGSDESKEQIGSILEEIFQAAVKSEEIMDQALVRRDEKIIV